MGSSPNGLLLSEREAVGLQRQTVTPTDCNQQCDQENILQGKGAPECYNKKPQQKEFTSLMDNGGCIFNKENKYRQQVMSCLGCPPCPYLASASCSERPCLSRSMAASRTSSTAFSRTSSSFSSHSVARACPWREDSWRSCSRPLRADSCWP